MVHLVAFEDRQNRFIFLGVPDERGRYLRTDRSVALVPCPMCRSMVGEPCKAGARHEGYTGVTHAVRRSAASHALRGASADVEDIAMEHVTLAPDGSAAEVY